MELNIALKLLKEYERFPKNNNEPTYLEICSYPKRRFEEICSRILCFYFNPNKEHGLRDLFLFSLFELLKENELQYRSDQIKVITEENAEGKRIDLLVMSPDFIIGIENKISASLYNPLAVYKKRIDEYSKSNTIKLVLSLEKIKKRDELQLMKQNGFIGITYADFFNVIKKNVGNYISNCNQKYLSQLFDFIQTLEKMKSVNTLDQKKSEFFLENEKAIKELINSYNSNKERVLNVQKEKISELMEIMNGNTENKWWAWQGWDLGFDSFNRNKSPRIGIESNYFETKDGPLGEFKIFITTWNLKDWQPFEIELTEKYPDKVVDKVNGRVYMHMDIINGEDQENIILKLFEYYTHLKNITD